MTTAPSDLVTTLESELLGVASFRTAYYLSFNSDKKRKFKALWQLGQQTLDRVREYYLANDLRGSVGVGASIKGALLGILVPVLPWKKMQELTLKETDHFLEVFRRQQAAADEKDRPFFQYVVDHELAIEQFARRELAGQGGSSLEAVEALLD